ncbi:unnamed protein product [Ilex paraguariensis]|uniref:Protein APEM9 n=1 Tax=Ilex paraguariensis TaxID=185542 RepID=A0ABC8TGW7_9AQUA
MMGIWEEIDRSESCLVCCMFEEAASLASSIIRRLYENKCMEGSEKNELSEMLESAGMVLVQSFKELGRTVEILKELKLLFGFASAIPVQVFLTGVCFQITEGPASGVREFLEEFLSSWRYVDQRHYVLASAEAKVAYVEGCDGQLVLEVDEYMKVVEVYVVTLLVKIINDLDFAISWVEESAIPEEKRQELLRRLHSIYANNRFQASVSPMLADECENPSASLKELNIYEGSQKALETRDPSDVQSDAKQALLKLSRHNIPRCWWFRTITLKFGNGRWVISNGNMLLGCLIFLMYYLMRRKQASLKRTLRKQASSIKKALGDLWQLAFSYQVNPLAAVQPLPPAMPRSR